MFFMPSSPRIALRTSRSLREAIFFHAKLAKFICAKQLSGAGFTKVMNQNTLQI
ncbi:MAG: hypothetical protein IPJ30_00130 [Acidobacteria bacterium]|nr:hypothetical protein [Acidobacteriota bacterium]MBK8149747.1 hypothetical protein [Acidobacteriota bacterium]